MDFSWIVEGFATIWIISMFTGYITPLSSSLIILLSLLIGFIYYLLFEWMLKSIIDDKYKIRLSRAFLTFMIVIGLFAGLIFKFIIK